MIEKKIDLFMDGFYTRDINCIDIPMAASCSSYNRDYYFFYIFLLIMFNNFSYDKDWYSLRKKIIGLLGGELAKKKIKDENEEFDCILENINNKNNVLGIFKYGSLPYSRYYKKGTYDHGVILCGVDEDKEIIKICDRELVREYIEDGIFSADVLSSQWITYEMLRKIIHESMEISSNLCNRTVHHKTLYVIHGLKNVHNWNDIKNIVYAELSNSISNNINDYIEYLRDNQEIITDEILQENRRKFLLAFQAIDKIYMKYGEQDKSINQLSQFLSNRSKLVNLIYKNVYTNKSFENLDLLLQKDSELAKELICSLGDQL